MLSSLCLLGQVTAQLFWAPSLLTLPAPVLPLPHLARSCLLQAGFVFALLPVMTTLRGMSLADLPAYVARGAPSPALTPILPSFRPSFCTHLTSLSSAGTSCFAPSSLLLLP